MSTQNYFYQNEITPKKLALYNKTSRPYEAKYKNPPTRVVQFLGVVFSIGFYPCKVRDLAMRVVREIEHPDCKITIFQWNNKYLIKLESGPFEQTFKINEFDVSSEEDLKTILNESFIDQALARFADMARSLSEATNVN